MLVGRNGETPEIAAEARIASSAAIVGNVRIGAGCYIDHGVVIESSGLPIVIGDETIIFAGAVLRSVGGGSRPRFELELGKRTLVSPHCVLTGCRIGSNCYIATGAIALQGSVIGDHVRVGAGAIVHSGTVLPDRARIGMRHIAVPSADGFITTSDIELARQATGAEFFETAFGLAEIDQVHLHEQVMSALHQEIDAWHDKPVT